MTTAHVDEATWEKLAMNELDGNVRAEPLRHAMACPRCRTIYRGVRALGDAARAEGLVPPPKRSPIRAWALGAGAVVVAAAAVVIAVIVVRDPGATRTTRGARSGAEIVVAYPAHVRAGDPLTWSPVAGAAAYRVEIFTADGVPARSDRTAIPSIAWPALASGAYRLRVTAITGDDATLATSRLVAIEVAP
jgi:hypothetical protein